MPAGGQQDGLGRLHAYRAELRPLFIGMDNAATAAAVIVGGTTRRRGYEVCGIDERQGCRLQLRQLCGPWRHMEWKVWLPCCTT